MKYVFLFSLECKQHTDASVLLCSLIVLIWNIEKSDKAFAFDLWPWWKKRPFKALLLRKSQFGHLWCKNSTFYGKDGKVKGYKLWQMSSMEFLLNILAQSRAEQSSGGKHCHLQHTHSYLGWGDTEHLDRPFLSVWVDSLLTTCMPDHTTSQLLQCYHHHQW